MKKMWIRRIAAMMAVLLLLGTCGCGATDTDTETGKTGTKNSALDPKNPVTITVWNYYNGDQLTAFDQLVEEFNQSVGIEKGIVRFLVGCQLSIFQQRGWSVLLSATAGSIQ